MDVLRITDDANNYGHVPGIMTGALLAAAREYNCGHGLEFKREVAYCMLTVL
jgi:hypothetical protein